MPSNNWPSTRLLFLLSMLVGTATLNVNSYIPAMPAIGKALGASFGTVQLSLSIFMWGYASGQLIIGPLSDHFGRMRILGIGLAAYTLANFACIFVSSIDQLLVVRGVQGLLAATGPVLIRAILNDRLNPTAAAKMLSSVLSIMALVPALAPIVSGWLVDLYDWQAVFIATTLFCFLLTVLSQLFIEESHAVSDRTRSIQPRQIFAAYRTVAGSALFWRYAITATGMFSAMFAYNAVNSFLIISDLGVAERYHGFTFALVAFAFIVGSVSCSRLTKYFDLDTLAQFGIYFGLLSSALAWLASCFLPLSLALVVAPGAFLFFANGFALPAAMSKAISTTTTNRGSASALVGFLQIGVAGLTGTVTAALYDHTTRPLHTCMFASALIATICWHWLKPAQSRNDRPSLE